MTIAGIIAEYNPFHRGHAYHIARTREITGCDYVVVCMGGHFTQRGEPAMWSKWARARMALACGADAVFELPVVYAMRPADAFARGGVAILAGIGADVLSFGSECDDMRLLEKLASLRAEEPEEFSDAVRALLRDGLSHAAAWGEAAESWLGLPRGFSRRPNLTLAVEYLRALRDSGAEMSAVAVRRVGEYHNSALSGFASSSAIREALLCGETQSAMDAIPEDARPWAQPEALHGMDDLLLHALRQMSQEQLRALPDVAEGLENRIYRLCRVAGNRETLLDGLKCRRYTRARLSRILTAALLGMDRASLEKTSCPEYARLLGIREDSAPGLMRHIEARARLPITSGAKALRDAPSFQAECRATDIWSLLHDDPALRRAGRELTEKFVRV